MNTPIQTRLRDPSFVPTSCPHCSTPLEYQIPSSVPVKADGVNVQCASSSCQKTWWDSAGKPRTVSGSSTPSGSAPRSTKKTFGRKIGSDEKPLDMEYYDLLGLPASCTTEEIKKAYRRLAIKHHPDKNPDDPEAAEKFRQIAVAYNTLSDPGLRHTYNEFGKKRADGGEEAMIDPEEMFGKLFGGDGFKDIIGSISLGSDMKTAMQNDDDEEDGSAPDPSSVQIPTAIPDPSGGPPLNHVDILEAKQRRQELQKQKTEIKKKTDARKKAEEAERDKVRKERVDKLAEKLEQELALYVEQAGDEVDEVTEGAVRSIWTIKAEELKKESFGPELLQTVGFVYSAKSKQFLASTGHYIGRVGGWYQAARSTAHIVGETVSTVRTAYALKEVFDKLNAAETSGLTEEKRKELEEKAAQMGLEALFKGAKLEVQSIIREVCESILQREDLPLSVRRKRAVALGVLGSVYESAKSDSEEGETIRMLKEGLANGMGK